jgi:uncharacterized protein (TIGR03663 family)
VEQYVQTDTSHKTISVDVDWFTIAFWGVVILAAILRFYDLGSKPLHHDESLYGVYCWRFFKGEGYRYDPMMHGPFMFHFQLLIFFLFGVGDFSVRFAPALFGTLMIAGLYYLKGFLGKAGVLAAAVFLTFSPTHLYFSRFMRHDVYSAFFTLAVVVFALLYAHTRHAKYLYFTLASLALMFCVKENAYIHAFIFMTFILLKDFIKTFWHDTVAWETRKKWLLWPMTLALLGIPVVLLIYFIKRPLPEIALSLMSPERWAVFVLVVIHLLAATWVFLYWAYHRELRPTGDSKKYLVTLAMGTFLLLWIYILLYSTMLTNRTGVIDGVAKSWTYWWEQHTIQRIKGPFHYYVSFIWQYELPVFLVAGVGILLTIANSLNKRIVAIWGVIFPLILVFFFRKEPLPLWLAPTHMEIWADLVLTLWIVGIGGWATLHFLLHQEYLPAFFTYWSGMGFLIYSYAGEKVPWLFLHVVLPVVLLAAMLVQRFFSGPVWVERRYKSSWLQWAVFCLGGILAAYTLHFTVLLNYYNPANPVETMVYTQTSTDMVDLVKLVQDVKLSLGSEEAKKPVIAVQGNAVWPMAWYMRDEPGWYVPGDLTNTQRPVVVIDWEARGKYQETFARDYREIRLKLREWWIPESDATIAQWIKYLVYREVFNPTGSSDVAVYVRQQ